MVLYEGAPEDVTAAVEKAAEKERAQGRKTGIIDFNGDTREAAKLFFARLRDLDKQGVDLILCAGVPEEGLGVPVMDRMRKAAGENIVCVSKGE
ncbi:MAG: Sua5 family C-terminal domain-containing protein [Anaerovoracaceae bacterium]|nr:Sua5 family C-terminal domain-containing protein [Bacillota bacterium]MDY2670826.1 Sua5 family C-terminal domain-containing protein [Anaerovoracaceae bacterium]